MILPLNQKSVQLAALTDGTATAIIEDRSIPLVFTKFTTSIISATNPMAVPFDLTDEVDYEVELGIVMGKNAKNVFPEDAMEYVFGYTVINNISARDLQFSDNQWVRGKSLDTFCLMGPVTVSTDEIAEPQKLDIGCSVNSKTLQETNTKNMIFGVADLTSRISHSFTLETGVHIASGAPQGVRFSRTPPVFLTPGDMVQTWVKAIGKLENPVIKA